MAATGTAPVGAGIQAPPVLEVVWTVVEPGLALGEVWDVLGPVEVVTAPKELVDVLSALVMTMYRLLPFSQLTLPSTNATRALSQHTLLSMLPGQPL